MNKSRLTSSQKLAVHPISGGKISKVPVKFSFDSKYYFVCVASIVQVILKSTGQIIRTLENENEIVSLQLVEDNKYQIATFTRNGVLTLWDFTDGEKLSSKILCDLILLDVLPHPARRNDYLLYCENSESGKKYAFYEWSSSSEKITKKITDHNNLFSSYCISLKFKAFAYTIGNSCHWTTFESKSLKFKNFSHEKPITISRFGCGSQLVIATGDTRGQIYIWHLDSNSKPTGSKIHWHSHPVLSLEFSSDGSLLYSGGEEAVLVVWNLSNFQKQFLPRLCSPIEQINISTDQLYLALSHRDNSIKVLSASSLNIESSVTGLKFPVSTLEYGHSPLRCRNGGILMVPNSSNILVNAGPNSLQLWDYSYGKHIMEIDVTERPRVYKNDSGLVRPSQVQHACISSDGAWMATIDCKGNVTEEKSLCLKFWKYDFSSKTFSLEVRIDEPHRDEIKRIQFHPDPTRRLLVTASKDKYFRLWKMDHRNNQPTLPEVKSQQKTTPEMNRTVTTWSLLGTGFWREFTIQDACFSQDGSVLAVAHEKVITLWNPFAMSILKTFFLTGKPEVFTSLIFAKSGMQTSPYILSSHSRGITIWNSLNSSVYLEIENICPDFIETYESDESFIVGFQDKAKKQRLLKICCKNKSVTIYQSDRRLVAGCVDSSDAVFRLVCFDDSYDLVMVYPESSDHSTLGKVGLGKVQEDKNTFSALFPAAMDVDDRREEPIFTRNQQYLEVFSQPTHLLPSLPVMTKEFLYSILVKKMDDLEIKQEEAEKESEVIEASKYIRDRTENIGHPWNGLVPSAQLNVLIK